MTGLIKTPKALRSMLTAMMLLVGGPALASDGGITPRPLSVVDVPGPSVQLGHTVFLSVATGDKDALNVARYLADLSRRSGGPRLVLGSTRSSLPAIRFVRRDGMQLEGYVLDVDRSGATITASTHAGLLYGAISLWQLMNTAPGNRLARVHIADAPRFSWRGVLLDSARHFQSASEIARILDWMALHKLNRLQWHLTDDQAWRLEIKRFPRLTGVSGWRTTPPAAGLNPGRYGGYYTQLQVQRIVALAAARNIIVVPEIEMPGHATAAILAYPRVGLTTMTTANLGDWGVFPSIYGVSPPAFTFLHGVLDEVMRLFPSREIAIGGDEAVHTGWHENAAVQTQMRALKLKDENALQAWFIGQIGTYLREHGRRLVGWDEILSDRTLPKNDIVLSWHGADGAIAAARAGHDVVMATAPTLYFDNRQSTAPSEPPGRGTVVSLSDVYSYDPGNPPHSAGSAALDTDASAHILGVQGALWSEHIATDARLESMALPRAAALGEIGWTAKNRRDWPSFVARMPAMFARYRSLGLKFDDGALAVQPTIESDGARVRVSLSRQLKLGEIRFTTDGTTPTPASSPYTSPIELNLPARLRAASFDGTQRLSRELDLPLDSISSTRRSSQQLELCTAMVSLNVAGRTGAYLVDIKNPCWIYRGAQLTHGAHLGVSVARLPFNFQLANEAVPIKPVGTSG
ncbi:MAG: family 20 glycosylhydrolase, partial [Pseudomonadota bacterium]|nr:family 20 glycosylhydrolase [Pseudomonadota bacterium]